MKKTFFIPFLLLCFIVFPYAQEKPTLTVLDFDTNNISERDMKSIVTYLSAAIFETGLYRVIDTAQRDTILNELEFSLSGCSDESCQLEVGRLLSAEIIVTGNISLVGGRYICTARMIETETSETISTAKSMFQSMEDLLDGMDALTKTLISHESSIQTDMTESKVDSHPALLSRDDTRSVSSARSMTSQRIAAWTTLGAGAIFAGIGGYFIYDALRYKHSTVDVAKAAYDDQSITDFGDISPDDYYDALYAEYITTFNRFKTKAVLALAFTGGGILTLGTSALFFFIPEKKHNYVSLLFFPSPRGCSFGWSFRF